MGFSISDVVNTTRGFFNKYGGKSFANKKRRELGEVARSVLGDTNSILVNGKSKEKEAQEGKNNISSSRDENEI